MIICDLLHKTPFHVYIIDCAKQPPPFGMESGAIQNSQITSSSFASGYPPYAGRLNNLYGAWCAGSQTTGEWLQVDLGSKKELLAVQTEGFWSYYITGYYLLYSFDAVTWYCFGYEGTPKVFYYKQYNKIKCFSLNFARLRDI